MNDVKDDKLWRIARKRAEFKKSLYSYVVVVSILWIIWWFTTGQITGLTGYPWPVWVMLGWGVGLIMQYFGAYKGNQEDLVDREYERLKKEREGL